MALLKAKDVAKMNQKDIAEKLKELKLELMKSQVGAQKSAGKTKEIKRAIARLHTFNAVQTAGKRK
ncbi:MAG: 50S ribosomal protein L29 [Nanoarchaeota archaeon]